MTRQENPVCARCGASMTMNYESAFAILSQLKLTEYKDAGVIAALLAIADAIYDSTISRGR
jgi:hypothetical protein